MILFRGSGDIPVKQETYDIWAHTLAYGLAINQCISIKNRNLLSPFKICLTYQTDGISISLRIQTKPIHYKLTCANNTCTSRLSISTQTLTCVARCRVTE